MCVCVHERRSAYRELFKHFASAAAAAAAGSRGMNDRRGSARYIRNGYFEDGASRRGMFFTIDIWRSDFTCFSGKLLSE